MVRAMIAMVHFLVRSHQAPMPSAAYSRSGLDAFLAGAAGAAAASSGSGAQSGGGLSAGTSGALGGAVQLVPLPPPMIVVVPFVGAAVQVVVCVSFVSAPFGGAITDPGSFTCSGRTASLPSTSPF